MKMASAEDDKFPMLTPRNMMPQSKEERDSIDSKSKSLESIERTVRTRVDCEERAFRIINKLIDGPVSGAYLVECGRLISKEHYNDIVEERAITQLCGYPVCSNKLGKTPSKKYHVSTKTNKVYEISERKNFCSNRCFKASRHFLAQIPDSPLWMRDKERLASITLLEHDRNKGIVGDEVIGPNPKQILRDEFDHLGELDKKTASKKHSAKPNSNKRTDLKLSNCKQERSPQKISSAVCKDSPVKSTHSILPDTDTAVVGTYPGTKIDLINSTNVEDLNSTDKRLNREKENELPMLAHKFGQITTNETPKTENLIIENLPASKKSEKSHGAEHSESVDIEPQCRENSSSKMDQLKLLLRRNKNILLKMADIQDISIQAEPVKNNPSQVCVSPHDKQNQDLSAYKHSSLSTSTQPDNNGSNTARTSTNTQSSTKSSPLLHVCNILKSWIRPETIAYLQLNNYEPESSQPFSDPQVQQSYGALCHRLRAQEKHMEALLDGDADTEKASRPSKPVPDYKALREQTEAYTLNVVEFITGKKQVPTKDKDKTANEGSRICLPTVDAYDQHQIRVRIVMDRFDKSLPEVLLPLGLSIQDASSPMRELVQTCRLEKNNIVLKPGEWTLAALLILKMLAFRYPMIHSGFASDLATRHFSAVLSRLGHNLMDLQTNVQIILDDSTNSR